MIKNPKLHDEIDDRRTDVRQRKISRGNDTFFTSAARSTITPVAVIIEF